MSCIKEKPASGGNHSAGLDTQNTPASLPFPHVLERIAAALEKNNEILAMQSSSLAAIVDALYHLKEA